MQPLEVTDVRIKLLDGEADKLLAFCTITLNGAFVVRDLKVIDGPEGPFAAMPSRKLGDRCPNCREKNPFRARYCTECGRKFRKPRTPPASEGHAKFYADIAHPITAACRQMIEQAVIGAYESERDAADAVLSKATLPGAARSSTAHINDARTENPPAEFAESADFAAGIL